MVTRHPGILALLLLLGQSGCSHLPAQPAPTTRATGPSTAEFWLTRGDQSTLFQKQATILRFGKVTNNLPVITVDTSRRFQSIDGFGFTLTGASALLINQLDLVQKRHLLEELFSTQDQAIGVSYLRLSIGASDLTPQVYTYDDLPAGSIDLTLAHFTLKSEGRTGTGLIPLLQEILRINPRIKILATPWTPPSWMKDNGLSQGGHLKPEDYDVYARYLLKYLQQMKRHGIVIDALTPQNEPMNGENNPSLLMSAEEHRDFIKQHLGPTLQRAGVTTKIIVWDHNCDHPEYPLTILNDAAARTFVDGSAFHLYAGSIDALSLVQERHPDKNIYFTEQYIDSHGQFEGDLKWHLKNVIIGSMRNWSRTASEWNLANDPDFALHTPGGCTRCQGALTIAGSQSVTRNVAYYVIAHAAKFVPAGSVRIASNETSQLLNVAFETPQGRRVLLVLNEGSSDAPFNLQDGDRWITATAPASSVGTFVW